MRMLVYKDCQRHKVTAWNVVAHPFEISVCNFELVKIHYAMCHLGKLWVVNASPRGECTAGLTRRKRLAFGLDLMYSFTFPFDIHSEMMRKYWGFFDMETPNKGKTFG